FEGLLGCAYRALPDMPLRQGVCSGFSFFGGSLNTGLVTLSARGARLRPRITQKIFAHEIGHSLGAQHDELAQRQNNRRHISSRRIYSAVLLFILDFVLEHCDKYSFLLLKK
ncbi:hypothetical protein PMAYCL1PPCAC_22238, partial [Pristionchus mayeri]